MSGAAPGPTFAIITPSYAGDFERCRLLCDSIDRFVSGDATHHILIDPVDEVLFRPLEGLRRHIHTDASLLPSWLKGYNDPFARGRRIWTGTGALMRGVPPLRGWHVQQLRKLAISRFIDADVLLFVDSDIVFLRPFAPESQMRGARARLFCRPGGLDVTLPQQVRWLRNAARVLDLPMPAMPAEDYINALVTWRRETALAMLAQIESVSGRDWVSAIARSRQFSEYLLYGLYATRMDVAAKSHWRDETALAHVAWFAGDVPAGGLTALAQGLMPGQVALCVQSFIGAPVSEMRALFEAAALTA